MASATSATLSPSTALTLSTGAPFPQIGFGTWRSEPGKVKAAVKTALETGYRHIDAAWAYQNEDEVGAAITEFLAENPEITRSDLFITTKLWCMFFGPEDVEESVRESLGKLGLDYVDLLLVHWPVGLINVRKSPPAEPFDMLFGIVPADKTSGLRLLDPNFDLVKTWGAVEKLVGKGLVRAVGISNCDRVEIDQVLAAATIPPAVNQIELHPFLVQEELVAYCNSKNITVTAYSPLANVNPTYHPSGLENPVIVEMAKRHGKSPAQVLLRFGLQRGYAVIPKSVTASRIKENFDVFDFELSAEDMEKLTALDTNTHQVNPKWRDNKPLWPKDV